MGNLFSDAASDMGLTAPVEGSQRVETSYDAMVKNREAEEALAQQLRDQAAGNGPNPALEQLKMTTDQNIRNQAASFAGNRGVNPAMAARLSAQNQAGLNQGAAGQAAVMRAQQQLAAQRQLQGLYGNIGSQTQNLYNDLSGRRQSELQANANAAAGLMGGTFSGFGLLSGSTLGKGSSGSQSTPQGSGDSGAAAAGSAGSESGAAAGSASAPEYFASRGGKIKGKAKVEGDSYDNDTVPTMLSPGEIVIPRTKAQDPDKAKAFVDAIMKKNGKSPSDGEDDDKTKLAIGKLKEALTHLSKKRA